MQAIFFCFFSFSFFILGLNCSNKWAFQTFLFSILVLPFTNIHTEAHVRFQIPIFLFFLLGGIIKQKYSSFSLKKTDVFFVLSNITFILFVISTLPLFLDHSLINIFKDLKLILFGSLLYLFAIINQENMPGDIPFFERVIKWNFFISCFIYVLMYKFEIHRYLTTDKYFNINEIRYINYASYIFPFFVLFALANQIRLKWITWFYIIVPLIFSGNRTIMVVLLILVLIDNLKRISIKRLFTALSIVIVVFFAALSWLQNVNESSSLYRFKKLLSIGYIYDAFRTRLTPFLMALESFNPINYFIGKGIGFTYYIPWFHYRKELDDYNIYLDSLFPTLYGKYGMFFFLPVIIFVILLKKVSDKKSFGYYISFFFILSITNSFFYQNYLILALFTIYYMKVIATKNYNFLQ